ncbi:MAG: hypothetical protein NT013_19045 [Planctomycetia bacterium]|nr:hypothetical protein [Planctomycetia bacterium]
MSTASVSGFMTAPVAPYSVASETSATRLSDVSQESAAADVDESWEKVLNEKFIDWGNHPEDFLDEGFIPPSHKTISLAHEYVMKPFRKLHIPPPQVVPDTHGGIVFERRDNGLFESIRVRADSHIEYCRFSNGKLVDRQMWR